MLFSVNCLNIVIILVLVLAALGMTTLLLLLAAQTASAQQQQQQPPPIMPEALSDQGTFRVEMAWTPADIGAGNIFGIRFI